MKVVSISFVIGLLMVSSSLYAAEKWEFAPSIGRLSYDGPWDLREWSFSEWKFVPSRRGSEEGFRPSAFAACPEGRAVSEHLNFNCWCCVERDICAKVSALEGLTASLPQNDSALLKSTVMAVCEYCMSAMTAQVPFWMEFDALTGSENAHLLRKAVMMGALRIQRDILQPYLEDIKQACWREDYRALWSIRDKFSGEFRGIGLCDLFAKIDMTPEVFVVALVRCRGRL